MFPSPPLQLQTTLNSSTAYPRGSCENCSVVYKLLRQVQAVRNILRGDKILCNLDAVGQVSDLVRCARGDEDSVTLVLDNGEALKISSYLCREGPDKRLAAGKDVEIRSVLSLIFVNVLSKFVRQSPKIKPLTNP